MYKLIKKNCLVQWMGLQNRRLSKYFVDKIYNLRYKYGFRCQVYKM